ncbi:AAA family ATPase [Bacillus sp. 165]|uniref:ATP-binding protein n=1 Tax=Bacillus sp. 165 TaxID=1529117 RepID=UPI001ADA34E5|nr:AAA family ATPase [Bacillus sp. 165]MBO9128739.1 AAA family ATPase [Bacillus sp. 165]
MKIEEIHIYGYGKLEEIQLKFSSFPVIYGENEAGKSTIMSFIRFIFFGFPVNRNEKRYEPKHGGKYGGSLTVFTEQYGKLRIERLPKVARGEVTAYFDDGGKGGEEVVRELVRGIDRAMFASIFAFDMHGLQNIHRMNEEEIGSYLFSAGTVGTDTLLRTEKKLQKEMDSLFKANGKKPIVNAMFQETASMHEKMVKWQEQLIVYEELKQKKKQYEERLSELDKQKQLVERSIQEGKAMLALQPLLLDKKKHESYLQLLEDHSFPADGVKRYDALIAELKPIELQLDVVSQKVQNTQQQLNFINVDKQQLEAAPAVEECRLKKGTYDNLLEEIENLKALASRNREEIEMIAQSLGMSTSRDSSLTWDTTLAAKEEVTVLAQKGRRLTELKHQLDERFQGTKATLEEYEVQIQYLQAQLLSEEELSTYTKQSLVEENAVFQEKTIQDLKTRKNKLEQTGKQKKKQLQLTIGVVFSIVAVLILFGLVMKSLAVSLSGIFIFVISIVILMLTRGQETVLLREIQEEISELEHKLDGNSAFAAREAIHKLEKHEQINQLLEREQFKLQQAESQYNRVVTEYEEWEKDSFQLEHTIRQWTAYYGLPTSITYSQLMTAFEQIQRIKDLYGEVQRQNEKITILEEKKEAYETRVYLLANVFGIQKDNISVCLYKMEERLTQQQQQNLRKTQLEEKKADWEKERKALSLLCKKLQEEATALFASAKVQDEEEFRKKGQTTEEINQTRKHLVFLDAQIGLLQNSIAEVVIDDNMLQTDYNTLLEELESKRQAYREEEQELQTLLAESKLHIASLEEGSAYADFLHSYELKKSQLREQAKKWAAYAVAKSILLKTKERYHQEKLPSTLMMAERYFQFLTENQYKAVYAPRDGQPFIVQRNDGTQFYANELSQATAEQLYLSLRLALANTYEAKVKYPLIIDDSFVNFDYLRTEKALSLLQELAKERQIFFFTCHEHMLRFFDEEQIVRLTENVVNQ